MMMNRELRLGILVDGETIAGWQANALTDFVEADIGTIAAFIVNDAAPAKRRSVFHREWSDTPWNLLNRLEARVADKRYGWYWGKSSVAVDNRVDIATFDSPTVVGVVPRTTKSDLIDRFAPDDVAMVEALDLDVLVRFGFGTLRGEILDASRNGIWSFHHSDNDVNWGAMPGLYEILEDEPYTGTNLQRLREDPGDGLVLRRARYITSFGSWNQNRRQVYAKSSRMLIDALRELSSTGVVTPAPTDERPFRFDQHRLHKKPKLAQSVVAAAKIASATVSQKVRETLSNQVWRLLVIRGPISGQPFWRAQELVAPRGRFWADPFIVERGGEHHVFFEDYDFSLERGRIGTGRLTDDGLVDVTTILAPDYHLSYPFVFDLDDVLHMIPESCENGTIELWRCVSFPDVWQRVGALIEDISAADTTLLRRDGLWWLFTNVDRDRRMEHNEELHLYTSPDLTPGSFTPHPLNPIVSDAGHARMAGPFQELSSGELIRPAQRGGAIYGTGLHFMRVDELSLTSYRETMVESVLPLWDRRLMGIHHCASVGDITLFDAARREPAHRHNRA